jgi:predicted RNase H-like HicB family nuclease
MWGGRRKLKIKGGRLLMSTALLGPGKTSKRIIQLHVIVERDGEGYYAYCPVLKGLHVGGATKEEVLQNAQNAAEAYIMSLIKHNEPIPASECKPNDFLQKGWRCLSNHFPYKESNGWILIAI